MTLDYCNKQTFLYYLSIMTNLTPVHLGRDGSRQAYSYSNGTMYLLIICESLVALVNCVVLGLICYKNNLSGEDKGRKYQYNIQAMGSFMFRYSCALIKQL